MRPFPPPMALLGAKKTVLAASVPLGLLLGAVVFASLLVTRSALVSWRGSEVPCSLSPELMLQLERSVSAASASSSALPSTRRKMLEQRPKQGVAGKAQCECAAALRQENQRLVRELEALKAKFDASEREKKVVVQEKEGALETLLEVRKQLAEGEKAMEVLATARQQQDGRDKEVSDLLVQLQRQLQEREKAVQEQRAQMQSQAQEKDKALELLAAQVEKLTKDRNDAEAILANFSNAPANADGACYTELKKANAKLAAVEYQLESDKASRLKVQSKLDASQEQLRTLQYQLDSARVKLVNRTSACSSFLNNSVEQLKAADAGLTAAAKGLDKELSSVQAKALRPARDQVSAAQSSLAEVLAVVPVLEASLREEASNDSEASSSSKVLKQSGAAGSKKAKQ